MTGKKLFEQYIKYFGDEPPFPPEHIMKTLVDMKRDGTFEEKMNAFKPLRKDIIGELEEKLGEGLLSDHPLFKTNFEE